VSLVGDWGETRAVTHIPGDEAHARRCAICTAYHEQAKPGQSFGDWLAEPEPEPDPDAPSPEPEVYSWDVYQPVF